MELPAVRLIDLSETVLVTGANGFIGVRLVAQLLESGFTNIRCFVRPSSRLERLHEVLGRANASDRVEIVAGDLISPGDCRRATDQVALVFHLAAGFDKSFAGAFMNSALATRNLMDALLESGRLKRFVNVSSFAVYSNLAMKRGQVLDEGSPLEDDPQARYDAYGFGKLKQEELVREYGEKHRMPYVILRPGAVFGAGKKDLSGRVGIDTFGFFMHVGGSNELPLTFVDNCADAILLAGVVPGVDGETFNVVDDAPLTSAQFLSAYRKRAPRFFSLRVPYFIAYGMCALWEDYSRRTHGQLPPAFNRRRCAAEWKGNRYTNQKLRERLGWRPRVSMADAMTSFLDQFSARVG